MQYIHWPPHIYFVQRCSRIYSNTLKWYILLILPSPDYDIFLHNVTQKSTIPSNVCFSQYRIGNLYKSSHKNFHSKDSYVSEDSPLSDRQLNNIWIKSEIIEKSNWLLQNSPVLFIISTLKMIIMKYPNLEAIYKLKRINGTGLYKYWSCILKVSFFIFLYFLYRMRFALADSSQSFVFSYLAGLLY